jgi:hypothetical protein
MTLKHHARFNMTDDHLPDGGPRRLRSARRHERLVGRLGTAIS